MLIQNYYQNVQKLKRKKNNIAVSHILIDSSALAVDPSVTTKIIGAVLGVSIAAGFDFRFPKLRGFKKWKPYKHETWFVKLRHWRDTNNVLYGKAF